MLQPSGKKSSGCLGFSEQICKRCEHFPHPLEHPIDQWITVLTRNLCQSVHNEIHDMQKPGESLPSPVFQVVAK